MTSLYPGLLFYSSGLNKKSTPTKPEATPSEIDRRLGRAPFNGRPWPKSSPVSTVYDVRNSSTRMIILNNKLSKRPKGSRLRGQSDHQGEIMQPEPNRHISEEPKTNCHHHKNCTLSVSEKFVPIFPPSVSPSPAWVNNNQRPPMRFDNGSLVNPNHHIQCQGHMDYDIMRWYNANRRPRSRVSTAKEDRSMSPILNGPGLSRGEKRYLTSIAKIYSVSDMRAQKQEQYTQLMWKEVNKGTYKYRDWEKYNRYLATPRKTQFGPCDPNRQSRSLSAPGGRKPSQSRDPDDESRPNTTQTTTKPNRSARDAQSTSSSRGQRPRERPNERRAVGRQNSQDTGAKKSGKARGSGDLTGKSARVESPMPLKSRDALAPSPSLSSLSDAGDNQEDSKRSEQKAKTSPVVDLKHSKETKDTKAEPQQKTQPEDETPRATDVTITVEEVHDRSLGDEDERSKISARDTHEQRGNAVEYHPTYGDIGGQDERSREKDGSEQEPRTSTKETYQPAKSPSKLEESKKEEKKGTEQPKQQATSGEKGEGTGKKGVVATATSSVEAKQSVEEKKEKGSDGAQDTSGEQDGGDSFAEDGPELKQHVHREGKDRPLSRLGGREQLMVVKKENENSDDDYSDDDEESHRSRSKVEESTDQARGGHTEPNQTTHDQKTDGRDNGALADNSGGVRGGQDASQPHTDDHYSEGSSRPTEESNTGGAGGSGKLGETVQPATPTEASSVSQEKPSDISTIEY
ncbi:protein starmaker [Aplysia californica]|uniref:Protein starmaker n=1 Tax=Aplysia californica TaxID=6500 RepID=A0ABM1ADE0_APLCA|nr:protein starmaker [Aplysia californica]